jgi:hypothetical protein
MVVGPVIFRLKSRAGGGLEASEHLGQREKRYDHQNANQASLG